MSDNGPARAGDHSPAIAALRREALAYIRVQRQCKDVIDRNRDEIENAERQLLEAVQGQANIEAAIEKLRTT